MFCISRESCATPFALPRPAPAAPPTRDSALELWPSNQHLQVTALRAGPLRGARTVGAARGATAGRLRCARRTDGCGAPPRAWQTCWACGPPRATATSARARIGAAAPRRRRNRPSRRSRRLRGGACGGPAPPTTRPSPRRPRQLDRRPTAPSNRGASGGPDLVKRRNRRRPPWRLLMID